MFRAISSLIFIVVAYSFGSVSMADTSDAAYLLDGIDATRSASQGKRLSADDSQKYGYTVGLVMGVSDILVSLGHTCPPEDVNALEYLGALEEYIHSEDYQEHAQEFRDIGETFDESAIVFFAMTSRFPCN